MQLRRGAILYRVRHEYHCPGKTNGGALELEGILELCCEYKNARQPAAIEIAQVVRTARGTGPSIGKGDDHGLAFAGDLLQ